MVFTGQLSKACQRCRQRRLRCNLQRPSCSTCIRANEICVGYRDTDGVRILDQTERVRSKATDRAAHAPKPQSTTITKVGHFPQNLQIQGRDAFFAWFLPAAGSGWDFLNHYAQSSGSPAQVDLCLDAVSLAFLSHKASSPMAKQMAREKYVKAIKRVNKSLRDPVLVKNNSALESALLLDLFEKISKSESDTLPSNYAHIGGALALVKHRGVEQFKEIEELKVLIGLAFNITMSAFSQGRPTPDYVWEIRKHCAQFIDTSHPRWRLGGIMAEFTDVAAEMVAGRMTSEERVSRSIEFDQRLVALDLEARNTWSYERHSVSKNDGQAIVPEGFPLVYDLYPNRVIAQARQNLLLTRMLLSEEIINSCTTSQDPDRFLQSRRAKLTIMEMVREVVASIPQMTDCHFAARHRLPPESHFITGSEHMHTVTHSLDVYSCIFTLFLMAVCRHCPQVAYDWAIKQLHLIAYHFGMKEAAINRDLLKQQELTQREQDFADSCHVREPPYETQLEGSQMPAQSRSDPTCTRPVPKLGPFAGLTVLKMPNLDGSMEWPLLATLCPPYLTASEGLHFG